MSGGIQIRRGAANPGDITLSAAIGIFSLKVDKRCPGLKPRIRWLLHWPAAIRE